MGLENRPYIGSWRLNGRELVQHTPDALVYLNGDTALPGCSKCSGRIDIQKFLTEVSVDAGVEPGSASASFTLSVPLHHTDSFARDAKFIIRPGLEVHVYMRGYFPVQGLFSHLAEGQVKGELVGSNVRQPEVADVIVAQDRVFDPSALPPSGDSFTEDQVNEWADRVGVTPDVLTTAIVLYSETERDNERGYIVDTIFNRQLQEPDKSVFKLVTGKARTTGFQGRSRPYSTGRIPDERKLSELVPVINETLDRRAKGDSTSNITHFYHYGSQNAFHAKNPKKFKTAEQVHAEWSRDRDEVRTPLNRDRIRFYATRGPVPTQAALAAQTEGARPPPRITSTPGVQDRSLRADAAEATEAVLGPSVLEEMGLAGQGLENTLAYPYYHVFHGVVTSATHSYSGGVNTITVTCNSMLHFWQYQNMSTNASVFGARPRNSNLKMSLVGHNFTGMHPYQIIYTLHHDIAGAAGGVAWALAQKTNQTAVTEVGQESLFSLNIRYWEKRFASRSIRLRMHGATGDLFTTMAAAWLGRTSANNILRLMRNRFNIEDSKANAKGILEQAQAVGLYNAAKRKALEALNRGQAAGQLNQANKPSFDLNIVEMQAFVSNIQNWGQVNLFESTYESKLDVAQKVMEVTGFEFYQDVDGDLVFKPPMWNLDTSSSRVYRIEDIDIISISFTENEPQATYMTCKGSHHKNLVVSGLENEWGVQGQYIDYRLVAQFGWRPGTLETAYFNDSKSMFFAAVSRMDVLNIGIQSANVTIPVRPELRPGFPVFIPYLDCFYYCNSFGHSHAVGGQCTTTLQLVGKRAKFYAPGHRSSQGSRAGIDDIKLDKTTLPQRPLQVFDPESGKPRLSGFPNVVMALDPTEINPMFFVVGNDLEDMSDVQVIKSLLQMGVQLRVLQGPDTLANGALVYRMTRTVGKGDKASPVTVNFYFQEGDLEGSPSELKKDGVEVVNILAAGQLYENQVDAAAQGLSGDQSQVGALRGVIRELQRQLAAMLASDSRNSPETSEEIERLAANISSKEEELRTLNDRIGERKSGLEATWRNSADPKMQGVAFLLEMRNLVGQAFRSQADFQGRLDTNSSINLLDMLSDKKATFSNGSQPGSYRYYSASHPDPVHQGPKVIEYDGRAKAKVIEKDPAALTEPPEILMYTRDVQAPPGVALPEARLVSDKPQVGIKVLDGSGVAGGVPYATSEIMELMFSVQPYTVTRARTANVATTNIGALGKGAQVKIADHFSRVPAQSVAVAINIMFGREWDAEAAKVTAAIRAASTTAAETRRQIGSPQAPSFPSTITLGPSILPTTTNFGTLKCKENPDGSVILGAELSKQPYPTVVKAIAEVLAADFNRQVDLIRKSITGAVVKSGGKKGPELDSILGAFNASLSASLGVRVAGTTRQQAKVPDTQRRTTFSPVFPVSDAQGYEVVGSYRYGRGVSIEPNGVFDQLHKKDIFSLLDKKTVEQILRLFVKGEKIEHPKMETVAVGGKKVTRPVQGNVTVKSRGGQAAQYLNEEVLRQLRRRGLTDKQILDYGFLLEGAAPDQLQFSLANIFADNKLDGVQKIPVINAGYSLADLNVQQVGHICDCKAAEADVLLSAYGQEEYVTFSDAGSPHPQGLADPGDAGTRFVQREAALAADTWRQQQQALRGQVLDRSGRHIVKRFAETFGIGEGRTNTFQQAIDEAQRNFTSENGELQRLVDQVGTQVDNLGLSPEEDQ